MRNIRDILILTALVVSLSGCISQNEMPSGEVKVATTIAPLGEFVRMVGGDKVSVTVMVPPGGEPHTFDPTPTEIKKIREADLYVKNGAGLETWAEEMVEGSSAVIDTSKGVELIGSDGSPDPHIWLSPKNAMVQVKNIFDGLAAVDPKNRDYYLQNEKAYQAELEDLDAHLQETFGPSKRKSFITLHPAWSYLARDYGLLQIAIEVEEKEPGPRHISEVIERARLEGIHTVFVEPQFSPKMAQVIAREIDGTVVVLDPMAEDYVENLMYVADKIAESLDGENTELSRKDVADRDEGLGS